MDLSVIIPCYNLENYIAPLLTTLNSQNLFDYSVELIFVLDSCTDKTKKLIDRFLDGKQYAAVKMYTCEHRSPGLARNLGLEHATGDLVWFVDGDDWLIGEYALAKVIFELSKAPNFNILRVQYVAPEYFQANGYYAMIWQYVFRREYINGLKFTDKFPYEDKEFMDQVIAKLDGAEIIEIQDKLYYYNYFREGSLLKDHINALTSEE